MLLNANSYGYQPQDSYNLRGDWGPSSYNRNHIFVISYVYPLPFWLRGQTWYQKVLGGWRISGVTTIQTGLPANITLPSDNTGISVGSFQRPNLVGDVYLSSNRTQYLNPLAFTTPAPNSITFPSTFPIPTLGPHTQAGISGRLPAQRTPAPYNWLSA
jgi:hypothetical protein